MLPSCGPTVQNALKYADFDVKLRNFLGPMLLVPILCKGYSVSPQTLLPYHTLKPWFHPCVQ